MKKYVDGKFVEIPLFSNFRATFARSQGHNPNQSADTILIS